ncbi:Transcriptional regulator, TetR family [Alloactinosynnema sp. L-07]|uniref:TetR/AcrR family transcriptional regulator n=1 Tax=Alloactinosynnema sp. L-07 TaxID=1653480 RepID=UPI00065EF266|nr:TetR/AcrR family transcriptional regulator [Alloactinosynnema sp. L-07]CRK59403.1 Transcriptional regulator, TetR family [Alloactinosynnema sp. L-07]
MAHTPLTTASVIAEAAALADEDGFEAVTLSAVARRLGVRTPSLYSHVRDRDALLDGVSALALADLAARIVEGIAGRAGREALEGFAAAHRAYALESPGRWTSLQRRVGETAVRSDAAREVVALTAAVLRGYPVPADEHVHAVRVLGSTLNGFLALERVGGFDHSHPGPEVSWHKTVAALDALLRAWPAESGKDTTAP